MFLLKVIYSIFCKPNGEGAMEFGINLNAGVIVWQTCQTALTQRANGIQTPYDLKFQHYTELYAFFSVYTSAKRK